MDRAPIKVWEFYDAPEEYQALSRHGGDEDWIVAVPPGVDRPIWTEFGPFVVCDVSEHWLADGTLVLISAHA